MVTLLGIVVLWAGIIGGAISLFANLLTPLDMADWAWSTVQTWQEATPPFWSALVGWAAVEVPSSLVPALNIGGLLLLTATGVRIRDRSRLERATANVRSHHLVGAGAVLLTMGYIVVAAPSQATSSAGAPADASLIIYLAAAAASFSPAIAGPGNLIKRLWFMLGGVGVLIALNEATKLVNATTAPAAGS